MLKDVAYQISSGRLGKYYKTTIVDERKEIINEHNGRESVGLNTDVLYGFSKAYGISLAVRTLSPDYIICDEIGGKNEFDEILYAMNCGVKFIITVHAENLSDLKRKEIYKRLVADGIINKYAHFDLDDEIKKIFYEHSGNPEKLADILIDMANTAGGGDNITVIVIVSDKD